jgi:hypothetical protein
MTTQGIVMSGIEGDIFWDLAPYIVYNPGLDIGCNIYVVNPTETAKEYALMAKLIRGGVVLNEEGLPVFGFTWFSVEPGDLVVLKGALRFSDSNADLSVSLLERSTEAVTDSVTTSLVTPTSATSPLPPAWPGTTGGGTNWSSLIFFLMLVILGAAMASALKPKAENKTLTERRPANAG